MASSSSPSVIPPPPCPALAPAALDTAGAWLAGQRADIELLTVDHHPLHAVRLSTCSKVGRGVQVALKHFGVRWHTWV